MRRFALSHPNPNRNPIVPKGKAKLSSVITSTTVSEGEALTRPTVPVLARIHTSTDFHLHIHTHLLYQRTELVPCPHALTVANVRFPLPTPPPPSLSMPAYCPRPAWRLPLPG